VGRDIVTVVDRTIPATATGVLAACTALHKTIAARAGEIEAARRLPADLLEDLVGAGAFRLVLPSSHGGIGADLPSALAVFEALATADASTAWTVMIGSASWIDLAGLPRATFDALYTNGPDVVTAGAINPTGSIEAVDGGYRVTGRWGFASGCEHASWLFADCMEGFVDGHPQLRMALLSPDQVAIEDTWHVSGLCGTGSHHFRVDSVHVPADRTFSLLEAPPCLDAPIVRIPPPALISCVVASVAVGTARGALDEITALAAEKVPLLARAPLATNPLFQFDLAQADTELRAARALLFDAAAELWVMAVAGDEPTLAERARVRAAAVWATSRAVAVVETAYRHGGGSSVYLDNPLQRRLRDIHALTQHFIVRPDTLTTAGAILAGNEVDVLLF
jgi:alkylation response protein AidB-like acyl-CoA dehydrogenase